MYQWSVAKASSSIGTEGELTIFKIDLPSLNNIQKKIIGTQSAGNHVEKIDSRNERFETQHRRIGKRNQTQSTNINYHQKCNERNAKKET